MNMNTKELLSTKELSIGEGHRQGPGVSGPHVAIEGAGSGITNEGMIV